MYEIIDELFDLFSAQLTGRGITRFFKGRQEIPARDDMPILMIYPISTDQSHSGTVRDDAIFRIGIQLSTDIRKFYDNTNGQGEGLDAQEWLIKVVEERETDGDAKTNTIFYVINNNILISGKVLYTDDIRITYDPYYNNGEFPEARAVVEFTAHARPNRT